MENSALYVYFRGICGFAPNVRKKNPRWDFTTGLLIEMVRDCCKTQLFVNVELVIIDQGWKISLSTPKASEFWRSSSFWWFFFFSKSWHWLGNAVIFAIFTPPPWIILLIAEISPNLRSFHSSSTKCTSELLSVSWSFLFVIFFLSIMLSLLLSICVSFLFLPVLMSSLFCRFLSSESAIYSDAIILSYPSSSPFSGNSILDWGALMHFSMHCAPMHYAPMHFSFLCNLFAPAFHYVLLHPLIEYSFLISLI